MNERIVEMDRLLQVMEKIIKEQGSMQDVEAAMQGADIADPRSKKLETLKGKHKYLNSSSPEIMVKQIEDEIRLFHTEILGRPRAPVGQETLMPTPTKNPEKQPAASPSRCLVM